MNTKADWVDARVRPMASGYYYVIFEVLKDTLIYRKGEIEVTSAYYDSEDERWSFPDRSESVWRFIAWTPKVFYDVPEEMLNKLVTYLSVDVRM